MNWGQFEGNCTHLLHLKEILPFFRLTHISEFSNSPTSAPTASVPMVSITHLCNTSFKGCSPHLGQPQILPGPKKPSQRDFLHGVRGHLPKCPWCEETKSDCSSKGQGEYERKDYICLNCQAKLWEAGPPESDSNPHDVLQGRCFHGRGRCVFGSLAKGYSNFNRQPTSQQTWT